MSNRLVSIIIVTAGKNNYLESCLRSIKNQAYSKYEIIVIDNSLDPNFSQRVNADYPELKLYSSAKNLFYCQALNIGIGISKGDFILCLNDDVLLGREFISEALKGFLRDTGVGLVSGKILRFDGRTIDSTGLFLSCWRTAQERSYGRQDEGQFEKEEYVFGVNGAVAFYRRQMLEDIKEGNEYFDSDFRIFYEDLDIAWRAKRYGWRGYYTPRAIAYHKRGGTVRFSYGINKPYARRYLSERLRSDLIKNRYLTLIKNESLANLLRYAPCIVVYDLILWTYVILFEPRLIKSFILNLKYMKSALKKRRMGKDFSSL